MATKVEQVLAGSIGFFWPIHQGAKPDVDNEEPQRGYVRINSGEIEIQTLDEDPFSVTRRAVPRAIIAATANSGLVVVDVARAGFKANMGGGRASLLTYSAHTALTDVDIHTVSDGRFNRLAARFTGDAALRWTGLKALTQTLKNDAKHRIQEVEIRLHSVPDQTAALPRRREMTLSAHWRVEGDAIRGRGVETGFELAVVAAKPSRTDALLFPLLHSQNLLSLAFAGFFPVSEGVGLRTGTTTTGSLWNSALMSTGPSQQADRKSFPIFTLNDIGGVAGLARWVRLCEQHPRAVAPISNSVRLGAWSPEVQTLEVASAIEYWVAAHKRTGRAWTKVGANFAEALAAHVGNAFASLVGDRTRWSERFWNIYTGLKHDPHFSYTTREAWLLSETARYLLLAALLNRSATTKHPSLRLFSDHRLQRLGEAVREVL